MAKIQGQKEGKPILIFTMKSGPNIGPWAHKSTLRFMRILGDAILPPRALERRLQEDWARDAEECPRVLMSLRVDFGPMSEV